MRNDPLIPNIAVVTDIRVDTPDVKTFRVVGLDGKKPFVHIPGQCAMLSVPGVGEALFSITSSPTLEEYVEFSIKKCGLRDRMAPRHGARVSRSPSAAPTATASLSTPRSRARICCSSRAASVWPRCIPLSTTAVTTVTATARSTSSTAPARRTIW